MSKQRMQNGRSMVEVVRPASGDFPRLSLLQYYLPEQVVMYPGHNLSRLDVMRTAQDFHLMATWMVPLSILLKMVSYSWLTYG